MPTSKEVVLTSYHERNVVEPSGETPSAGLVPPSVPGVWTGASAVAEAPLSSITERVAPSYQVTDTAPASSTATPVVHAAFPVAAGSGSVTSATFALDHAPLIPDASSTAPLPV